MPRLVPVPLQATWASLLPGAALLVLAGCGDRVERFPPPCPQTVINRDAADLNRYRSTGRDLTDLVVSGRITGLNGSCTRTGNTVTTVSLSVGVELTRGPASRGPAAPVSYFVAVSLNDQILDKRVFTFRPEFPANTDRLRLTGNAVDLALPVNANRTAAVYKVTAGFQLTPDELATNRALEGLRR